MGKSVFTDTGGFNEAGYGDPVARVADLKAINGGARPALQSSTALRPVYGRGPLAGRRNLFLNTENIANFGQASSNAPSWRVVNGSFIEKEAYTFRGCSVYRTTTGNEASFSQYVLYPYNTGDIVCMSCFVKPLTSCRVLLWPFDSSHGGVNDRSCSFYFPDLTQSKTNASINLVEDGWYRLEFSAEVTSQNIVDVRETQRFSIYSEDGTPVDVLFAGLQIELIDSKGTNRATPVQSVESDFDVTEYGVSNPAYLRFDLSDDKMTHTFPNGFTGDVMLFGRNGSWIEENVTIAPNGDLNIGPGGVNADASGSTSNPDGGIPGVLEAIGDLVGWLPVGRVLSEQERQYMAEYYKERGAKGLLVPGPELIVNNDFSDGFTGWQNTRGVLGEDFDVIDGKLTLLVPSADISDNGQHNFFQLHDADLSRPYMYRARTSGGIYRTAFGDFLSSNQVRPVKAIPDQDGLITEGIGYPHLGSRFGIHMRYEPAGYWIDWFSLRELRPEEEW